MSKKQVVGYRAKYTEESSLRVPDPNIPTEDWYLTNRYGYLSCISGEDTKPRSVSKRTALLWIKKWDGPKAHLVRVVSSK
jgi:hypothetical protein